MLKALTIVLAKHLPISSRCTHVKGHGGAKAAVRQVMARLTKNSFVLRTDVKAYYASIDHFILLDRLAEYVKDRRVLNLLGQYFRRSSERGGEFWDYEKGISLGCPLSPLMGAFFLHELDQRIAKSGLFYVRFMDDIVVLAPSRWKLRRAVGGQRCAGRATPRKAPRQDLHRQDRERVRFSWLSFQPNRADGRQGNNREVRRTRKTRLYEQDREEPLSPSRLGVYVRRWLAWAGAV